MSYWRSALPSEIEVVCIEMICTVLAYTPSPVCLSDSQALPQSLCSQARLVIFLYCHSVCCPQLQACLWHPVGSDWRRCVCACSLSLLSPVPPHCHSLFLTPSFAPMSSAFSAGALGRNILENILCTALSCKCVLSPVPFTQLIQLGMLGTTWLGFHCFCFESFFLQFLLVPKGWKSNQ